MTFWTPWCADCGNRPVPRTGDACPGCVGRLHATVDPITRPAVLPMQPPALLRFLRWLGGTR